MSEDQKAPQNGSVPIPNRDGAPSKNPFQSPEGEENGKKEVEKKDSEPTKAEPEKELPKPTPPEKKATAPSESLIEEAAEAELEEVDEAEELLSEEEGDFFWVIQRVVWGILKTVVVIGIIGFVIWLIWGTGSAPKKKIEIPEVPKEVIETVPEEKKEESGGFFGFFGKKEKEVIEVPEIPEETQEPQEIMTLPPIPPEKRILDLNEKIGQWNQQSTILSSVFWLQRVNNFVNLPASELIHSTVPQVRADQINRILSEIQLLIWYSEILQQKLVEEYTYFATESQNANQDSVLNEDAFMTALQQYDGVRAETFLHQKARAEEKVVDNSVQASGRKIILQNIQIYDQRLRYLYENMIANKPALIYNIQVVNFPGSTLEIILSPQEWRSLQGQ